MILQQKGKNLYTEEKKVSSITVALPSPPQKNKK